LTLTAAFSASADPDLTPSVNYFNFDYGSTAMSDELDSIIAGRYEVLVADLSYGWQYAEKYNDLYAHDQDMEFYVYLNFNDPYAASALLDPVNEFVGPLMEADGHDSTAMYWHSYDYTTTDFGSYQPYSSSEFGSRLLTYSGTRALINNTDLNFIHHFTTYADSIRSKHTGTRNYEIAGLWFDNMSVPQTCGVTTSTSGRHIYEAALGGPDAQYGGWTISAWQRAFRDTVLVKYMAILGDSLENRLGLKVCINALTWAYGDEDDYAAGLQWAYFDGSLVKPVHREYEFGVSPHDHNQQLLYPGPNNSATSINPAVDGASYNPVSIYAGQVDCSREGVENWFNPGHGFLEYSFREYWYDCLVTYFLWRSATSFVSFANVPETRLGVLNWLDGGASDGKCVAAGMPGDSCYWIGALGVRIGRDGADPAWDNDVIDWYAASVECDECTITAGQGKDDVSQNWVVFRRTWNGDDGYRYMILMRPAGRWQTTFAGSHSPDIPLLDGPWQQLSPDGEWGSAVSSVSFQNGCGGIFRASADDCANPPSVPTLSSPNDGSAVSTLHPQLCINNSTPADGCSDAHTYTYEIYYDLTLTAPVDNPVTTSEGTETSCYTPMTALPSGHCLWWRVRCSNGTASSNWAGPFSFLTPNSAPPAPTPVSPANEDTLSAYQPNLVVNAVTDPDGTDVVYQFEISKFSDFSALAGSGVVTDSDGQATWQVGTALDNNSIYYWRARAYDGIDYSAYSSPRWFYVEVGGNTPPSPPTGYSPANGETTAVTSPTLTVNNGSDQDGNSLTYGFELYAADSTTMLWNTSGVAEGSLRTSTTVSLTLVTGLDYVWRANCHDGIIASDWSNWYRFSLSETAPPDEPPGTPVNRLPTNGAIVSGEPIQLEIDNSLDPDGDPVFYDFRIYYDAALTIVSEEIENIAEGNDGTSAICSFVPEHNHTYYWRVLAHDEDGWSPPSNQTNFKYVSLSVNVDEDAASPSSPPSGAVIHTDRPILKVNNVQNEIDNLYYFDISTDSSFVTPVISSEAVPEQLGDVTEWQVPERLEAQQLYYWRAKADEMAYGPLATFTITDVIFASPIPVHFAQGEVLTFHLPAEPVELLITTALSGETVEHRNGLTGEWVWDGTNQSGHKVASGVYLWTIVGTDYEGKIVVKP